MGGRGLALGLLLGGLACQAPAPPPPQNLVDAARIIREMMRREKLETAGFYGSYPNPKPSDFVGYISSDRGGVLWPPREASPFADDLEHGQWRSLGGTLLPRGIAYRRNRPDPDRGAQIIYRADDESGDVIVEAYTDPAGRPILVRRWKLPR